MDTTKIQLEHVIQNLVFVPDTSNSQLMVTGLSAEDAAFSALCAICTNLEYAAPLERTYVVHSSTGDVRYLHIRADSPDSARSVCTDYLNRWMKTRAAG